MDYIDPSKTMQQCIAALIGLDKYRFLLEQVHQVDVSSDEVFQRTFNGFFMVRRNDVWRKDYYGLFECIKRLGDVSFSYILEELYRLTGNVEASFVSKMLSTLKPEMPIWDTDMLYRILIFNYLRILITNGSRGRRNCMKK